MGIGVHVGRVSLGEYKHRTSAYTQAVDMQLFNTCGLVGNRQHTTTPDEALPVQEINRVHMPDGGHTCSDFKNAVPLKDKMVTDAEGMDCEDTFTAIFERSLLQIYGGIK